MIHSANMSEESVKIKTEEADYSTEFDADGFIPNKNQISLESIKTEPEIDVETVDDPLTISVSKISKFTLTIFRPTRSEGICVEQC